MGRKRSRSGSDNGRSKKRSKPSAKSKTSASTRIKKTILGMAESKREYLASGAQVYNHVAGSGLIVGGYAHPASTVGNNWLGTIVGDAKNQREGDSIYSKYIDYCIYMYGFQDRRNQFCRILIVKGTGNNAANYNTTDISDWFIADGTSGGSGYLACQPVDQTKYTVLRDMIVYPQGGYDNGIAPAANGDNPMYLPVRGRIKTGYKVQYQTGTTFPSKSTQRIQVAIIPISGPSATTDNVLSAVIEIAHYFVDM